MGNFLYWALRTFLWLVMVVAIYFAILHAQGRLWLQIALVALAGITYSLLDQPLREMRARQRTR
jgi:hypothetical protein